MVFCGKISLSSWFDSEFKAVVVVSVLSVATVESLNPLVFKGSFCREESHSVSFYLQRVTCRSHEKSVENGKRKEGV